MVVSDPTIEVLVTRAFRRAGVLEHGDGPRELHVALDEMLDKATGSWQLAMVSGGDGVAALSDLLTVVAALRDVLGYPPSKTAQELADVGAHRTVRYCTRCHHPAAKGTGAWSCGLGCWCATAGGCLPGGRA